MQDSQVAVAITAAKLSQNLPLNDVTVTGQSQGWLSLRQALGTADTGYSRMGVLGAPQRGAALGFVFQVHTAAGIHTGWVFAGAAVSFVFD